MAFTQIIRRAATCSISSSVRSTIGQRYYNRSCATLFSAAAPPTRGGALSQRLLNSSFSSAAQRNSAHSKSNDTLVKIIDSEIRCAQESDETLDEAEDVPENFPFEIMDEPGKGTLTLTRDHQGERITVVVHMPDLVTGEEEEEDDDDDSETGNQSRLPMIVRVSKKDGSSLEFDVFARPDEIEIQTMAFKDPEAGEDDIAYEGPDFSELDENLQNAFYKYLDIRGINPRSTNFLHEYMINKDSKEYVQWLKKVKKFVEA